MRGTCHRGLTSGKPTLDKGARWVVFGGWGRNPPLGATFNEVASETNIYLQPNMHLTTAYTPNKGCAGRYASNVRRAALLHAPNIPLSGPNLRLSAPSRACFPLPGVNV